MKKLCCFFCIFSFLLIPSRILAHDCSLAKKWYHKGIALSNASQEEIDCYKKAKELCPKFLEPSLQLGHIYRAKKQWDLAIKEFKYAASKTSLSTPHTNLGEIYRLLGKYEQGIQEFQIALDLNPEDKQALSNLEFIYKTSGRYNNEAYSPMLVPSLIFDRDPGFTLPQGITLVDVNLQSLQLQRDDTYANEDGSERERTVNIWKLTAGIRYGVTNNFTLGLLPKFFWKKAYIKRDAGGEYQPTTYGLGDTSLLLRYCLWYRKKASLATSLNINIPTGNENQTGYSGDQPFTIPLGTGKYEFMPSLSFSRDILNLGYLHANFHYYFTQKRDSLDPGDEMRYNLGFCNSISLVGTPYLFSFPVSNLITQLELNGVTIGDTKGYDKGEYGVEEPFERPGGTTLFLSPGVQLLSHSNLKWELGVQFPVLLPDDPWINQPVFHIGLVKFLF